MITSRAGSRKRCRPKDGLVPAKAAIFDLDGTLIDSAALHAESWHLLAAEQSLELDPDWFQRTFGRANRDIIPEMTGRAMPADEIAAWSDRKEELYRGLAAQSLVLFDGARQLLDDLAAAGWRLGIGSSTPRANLDFSLPLLGIDDRIEATVGMEEVSRHKPEPDTFLEVARRLGVAPERCLVFEDAPAGIQAARRGGMKGVAVTTHHPASSFDGLAVAIRDGIWSITAEECGEWLSG